MVVQQRYRPHRRHLLLLWLKHMTMLLLLMVVLLLLLMVLLLHTNYDPLRLVRQPAQLAQ